MKHRTLTLLLCGLLSYGAIHAVGPNSGTRASEPDYSAELPRTPGRSLAESLKTFELPKGYRIECLASEPLVASPVATCFDADGNLYIVEMRDYSEQETESLGRVRRLVDTDQDGVFDKATIYTEGLSWPTAIVGYNGGFFVGAAPDIWYFKDTDGDGVADEKKVVFTGFGRGNVQGLMNSFRWGLDNRIHCAASSSGGIITRPDRPDLPGVDVRGRDFSFDPAKLDLRTETGGGQHGMSFDDWGRKFACSNSNHAQFILFEERYLARNPNVPAPSPRMSIAVDGEQAEVFRASPVEPWRIVRTRLRVQGIEKGAVEGGGRAAGYFTGATGITIYRGDALGKEMAGAAIVADVGSNIVHRKKLIPNGISFDAVRVDDRAEFVRSSEIWFRPVQFANSPDGCLHILDMYREVVEHPKSIPLSIKKHLDLTNGRDQGRIYRVTPENYKFRPTPQMTKMSSAELVPFLAHDNSWHRETAGQLLFERQDRSVVGALRNLATTSPNPKGRLHAMATLHGLGELDEATVLHALSDDHPRVREWAVKFSEAFPDSASIHQQLAKLTTDDDLRVRYQLAFTAGEFPQQQRVEWLTKILQKDAANPWIGVAALSSLSEGALPLFTQLVQNKDFRSSPDNDDFLTKLLTLIGRQNVAPELEQTLALVQSLPSDEIALKNRLLLTMMAGPSGSKIRQSLSKSNPDWMTDLVKTARQQLDSNQSASTKLSAIDILKLSNEQQDLERLINLLNPTENQTVQLRTLNALRSSNSVEVANLLLARWSSLSPKTRQGAEELLFSRPNWVAAIFAQIEGKQLPATSFNRTRLQTIVSGKDAQLAKQAALILKSLGSSSRADVVQQYASALTLAGDATRGKALFQKECSGCHRVEGIGFETGPNLAAMRNRGKEAILLNVFDPNREVNPEYLSYVIALEDGRTVTGMIRAESATSLTLLRAENQSETVLRGEIEQIRNSGLSLMPEGLEKQIDQQGMADLLEYLMNLKSDN